MRFDDTKLTAEEISRLGRFVELDLRGSDLNDADVQRVLEGAARQSNDSIWKRAAFGSDAQFKRLVASVKAARRERDDAQRVLGR